MYCIEMEEALDPVNPIFASKVDQVVMMAITPTAALLTPFIERSTREGTLTPNQCDDFVLCLKGTDAVLSSTCLWSTGPGRAPAATRGHWSTSATQYNTTCLRTLTVRVHLQYTSALSTLYCKRLLVLAASQSVAQVTIVSAATQQALLSAASTGSRP
jgi:hypothetical protein